MNIVPPLRRTSFIQSLFRSLIFLLLPALFSAGNARGQITYSTPYTIITLAGYAGFGFVDGVSNAARFCYPEGAAADSAGNIYVADTGNDTIRKITPGGVVTTLAGMPRASGTNDGIGSAARFHSPFALGVDTNGNVYVADTYNSTIRKVTQSGVVTTVAGLGGFSGTNDATGSAARFDYPQGVAVDDASNIYVADTDSDTIRKITSDGSVSTIAGFPGARGLVNQPGAAARFSSPGGLVLDPAGDIYIADEENECIREITASGVVSTIAGSAGAEGTNDGVGTLALFYNPSGITMDGSGNLYVADTGADTIRRLTPQGANWLVSTLAGEGFQAPGSTNATGNAARFASPTAVTVNGLGNIYVADEDNSEIRQVTQTGVVTTLAGAPLINGGADGTGEAARFGYPMGVATDNSGTIYVADEFDDTVRKVTPAGIVTTLAGLHGTAGTNDGLETLARFRDPYALAVDGADNIYVADTVNHTIRMITSSGQVTTLAGHAGISGTNDGIGSAARFDYPEGIAVDSAANVYVADTGNSAIRELTLVGTNWTVITLAGLGGSPGASNGNGSSARFSSPYGITVNASGSVYIADSGNDAIRTLFPAGTNSMVSTLAGLLGTSGTNDGTGNGARFNYPEGITVDRSGNLYVSDTSNVRIRKVSASGVVSTLAGSTYGYGSGDGTGSTAQFEYPVGITVDNVGNVYLADPENYSVRKGILATLVPPPTLQSPILSTGQFGCEVTGLPGMAIEIQSSIDFINWQLVGTYALEGGSNHFVNPYSSVVAQFYRGHVR